MERGQPLLQSGQRVPDGHRQIKQTAGLKAKTDRNGERARSRRVASQRNPGEIPAPVMARQFTGDRALRPPRLIVADGAGFHD